MNGKQELTSRAASGALWLVGSRLATKLIDFATLLILARLLTPLDFGLIAIAMPMVQIVEAILEIPISQVLVTRAVIDKEHLNTAFTLGVIRGLFLAAVSALVAFPLAYLYHDDRLLVIVPLLGLAPAMRGLGSPQLAIFAQRLDYRPNFVIELSGKLAAFVLSCAAAIYLHDYHALLIGTLASPTVGTVTSYIVAPLRPRFSLKAWPSFAHFLGWTTASQALAALNWQCDRLLLGRYVTKTELGVFSLANDLSYLPEQALVKPVVIPLMSAFVAVRTDKQRLASAYSLSAVTVLAIGMPVMLMLSLLADPIVSFALGGKWLAAVPYLQFLAITLIPPLFIAPLPGLAMAVGQPKIVLYQAVAETICKLPLIAAGAAFFGTDGVIMARGMSSVLAALVAIYFVRYLIGTPMRQQLLATWRVICAGIVLAGVLFLLRPILENGSQLNLLMLLPVVGLVGLACYCGSMACLWHISGRPDGLERMLIDRIGRLLGGPFWGTRA